MNYDDDVSPDVVSCSRTVSFRLWISGYVNEESIVSRNLTVGDNGLGCGKHGKLVDIDKGKYP